MQLERSFLVVPGLVSERDCERIIAAGEAAELSEGTVQYDPTDQVRSSSVAWLYDTPEHTWLFDRLTNFVGYVNRRLWNWDIGRPESLQYTSYGPDQYYKWHADQHERPYAANERWGGLTRKVSLSVMLNDGDEYEGGDFEIEHLGETPDRLRKRIESLTGGRGRGSMIIFPSHLYHRITPVNSGVRKSLVAWFLGPPFT